MTRRAGWRTFVAVGAVAVVAAACHPIRPGDHHNPGLDVAVGVPGAAGARVVDVTGPVPRSGPAPQVSVWVDRVWGAPVARGPLPLRFTLDVGAIGPGRHRLVALSRTTPGLGVRDVSFTTDLRLNQVQVLGSHNSYHVAPTVEPWSTIEAWQFTHDPLAQQFESEGIRQIELDVYADPNGIRVLHVPDVDFGTTCATWVECLRQVKAWSDAHPRHMPLTILTELNDTDYGFPTPIRPWDGPAMDQLDAEIRSVFGPHDVITPDSVRGRHATLAEAITTDGWPRIDDVRGKVMFVMDNSGSYRDTYTAGHPTLEHRMIFTNSDVGRPDAAFVKENDPIGSQQTIRDLVAAGYVVRTRADADTVQARANDTTQRDAAIASGAQWVSTDFEVPGRAYGTSYFVAIPGGTPARCNPINAPSWCRPEQIESLGS